MSIKQCKQAGLTGFDGPFFPELIGDLNSAFAKAQISGERFTLGYVEKRSEALPFYSRIIFNIEAATTDYYGWFAGIIFKIGRITILIMLPYAHDFEKIDGSLADRSIAVYTQGTPSDEAVDQILRSFLTIL